MKARQDRAGTGDHGGCQGSQERSSGPSRGVTSRVQAAELECKPLVSQGQLFAGTQPAAPQPWVSLQASASRVPSAPADRARVTLTGP